MNKVHVKTILSKSDFPFKSYDKKLVFLQRMGNIFPTKHKKKNLFFSNPCGQLLQNFLTLLS
jgi:hypothetical protein